MKPLSVTTTHCRPRRSNFSMRPMPAMFWPGATSMNAAAGLDEGHPVKDFAQHETVEPLLLGSGLASSALAT